MKITMHPGRKFMAALLVELKKDNCPSPYNNADAVKMALEIYLKERGVDYKNSEVKGGGY